MPEELKPGFLTRSLSNPWISLPLAIGAGIGSTFRRTAPFARGAVPILNLGLAGEQANYERQKEKRLSEVMGQYLSTAEDQTDKQPSRRDVPPLTSSQRDKLLNIPEEDYLKLTSREVEEMLGSGPTIPSGVPSPSGTGQEQLPPRMRRFLGAISSYDPQTAVKILGQHALRPPERPIAVNPPAGGRSLLVRPSTGEEIARFEGPEKPETGGPEIIQLQRALDMMDERGVPAENPARARIAERIHRLTGPRELAPEDREWREQQIRESQARVRRIEQAARVAADPRATLGQLSSSLNALIRERDSFETPEDEKPIINQAIRVIRGRIAEIGGGPAWRGSQEDPLGIR